jgi:hypothetical protein
MKTSCSLLLLVVLVFAQGCGKPSGKVPVNGVVTWNGTPVKDGFITFKLADGKFAPEAGRIQDGSYAFDARPGKNNVEIRASKETTYNVGLKQMNLVQYIPSEFNTETKLTAEVSAESGKNSFEFKLTGKAP